MKIKDIILVTGNKNKLKEYQQILGEDLHSKNINLSELQKATVQEVALEKAKTAFAILKKPVIVDDSGFSLDELGGLPGPFIKFFEKKFPKHSLVKLLDNATNRAGYAEACIAYSDGKNEFVVCAKMHGSIIHKIPEDTNNSSFSYDACLIPEGYDKTVSQLGSDVKNTISHRRQAIEKLREKLKEI